MHDNDHVPTPPSLYEHEIYLVIGKESDKDEVNYWLQRRTQREDSSETD